MLTEKTIGHGDFLLQAIPIGGLRMIDGNEADDKIIAVMRDDALYGQLTELAQCPPSVIERLRHYFLTYKHAPGSPQHKGEITHVYGCEEAYEAIRRSQADYVAAFMGADVADNEQKIAAGFTSWRQRAMHNRASIRARTEQT